MNNMTLKDFVSYMQDNLSGYQSFYKKALEFQKAKNGKRPAKSRWTDAKVEKAVNEMWKQSMSVLYEKIKPEVRDKEKIWGKRAWIDYMNEKDMFEQLNESLAEVDFNDN